MTAAKGFSLHVGLNRIDPNHYGTDGKLNGCEADAHAMAAIAKNSGFSSRILLNEQATSETLFASIQDAARCMSPSDIFFLSYAGHGSRVPDANDEERDERDETWCLYDRMVLDDELDNCWSAFPPNSRVVVVSDSCHSGTVARELSRFNTRTLRLASVPGDDATRIITPRVLPHDLSLRAFETHPEVYSALYRLRAASAIVQASVLLLAACQDDQVAADGSGNGWFTSQLLAVWQNGGFTGSYRSFYEAISKRMSNEQKPNYYLAGARNEAFENQRPFVIQHPQTGDLPMNDITDLSPRVTKLLGNGNGHSTLVQPRGISGGCHIGVEFNRSLVEGLSDEQLLNFFQSQVAPRMLDNYLTILGSLNPIRPRSGSVSCTASSGGGGTISCTGSVSW